MNKKQEKPINLEDVTRIVEKNNNLPINEIKRIVKKKYPSFNAEELINIITSVEEKKKARRIAQIISRNKSLPLNEIKKKVKMEFPNVNIDKINEIITSERVLKKRNAEREER